MEGTNWKINWSLFDSFVSEMMSCRVVREGVSDKRVHGLLYFLPPTGHGIRWARTAFEKMRWNQNISLKFNIFHNPCTQNRNLQGHWHWDNEKTAWQGAILKTILPFLSMERDIPSHHWELINCICAGEPDPPDRQGWLIHQGGAAGIQAKCTIFYCSTW